MKNLKNKKQKLAIVSLSSCEGCQAVLLDMGKKFLDVLKKFELVEMSLLEDEPDVAKYDVAVVEGSAITQDEEKKLKQIRKKTKIFVSLGACACIGGIPERGNPERVKPLSEIVEVDLEIPGCPPTGKEVIEVLNQLSYGRIYKIPKQSVCFECTLFNKKCFLHQRKLCLGPVTLAGCNAVCTRNNYRCEGCRGPVKEEKKENIKNMTKLLKNISSDKKIKELLEKFGVENDWYED